MILPEDHVGKEFGCFRIIRPISHGARIKTFLCVDSRTYRAYVLRLPAEEVARWDGTSFMPPVNRSIEAPNAEGSWYARQTYVKSLERRLDETSTPGRGGIFARLLGSRKDKNKDKPTINVITVYGVHELQYLIPLSDPYQVVNALTIQELLVLTPSDDLDQFELWEDIVLAVQSDTLAASGGELSKAAWEARWGRTAFGPAMKTAIAMRMKSGLLPDLVQQQVLSRLPDAVGGFSELTSGLFFRLVGCVMRKRCSADKALRTVRTRYFRENLSWAEVQQMVEVFQVLATLPAYGKSVGVMHTFLVELGKPVFDPCLDSGEFRLNPVRSTDEEYSLFLQEFVGRNVPLPTVDVSSSPC